MLARIKVVAWLALCWLLASTYWYDCRIKRKCAVDEPSVTTELLASSSPGHTEPPLGFKFREPLAYAASSFPAYKTGILNTGALEQALEIVGLYFVDEQTGVTPDLGTLRAQAAARNFVADLEVERIKVSSRRMLRPAPSQQQRFAAVEFRWVSLISPMPAIQIPAPLAFARSSSSALIGNDFAEFKQAFAEVPQGQQLEITGVRYRNESAPSGVDLALARAQATQALFADTVAPRLTLLQTLNLEEDAPIPEPFAAVRFRWVGITLMQLPATVLAQESAATTAPLRVYFAVNSARTRPTPAQKAELASFVSAAAGRALRVVGYSDPTGNKLRNQRLARRRANHLSALLRAAGHNGTITSEIRVDTDPTNSRARHLKRRADAFLE